MWQVHQGRHVPQELTSSFGQQLGKFYSLWGNFQDKLKAGMIVHYKAKNDKYEREEKNPVIWKEPFKVWIASIWCEYLPCTHPCS